MSAGVGNLIEASDYTSIKAKVDAVFGSGASDSGYGQSITSPVKVQGDLISHSEWVNLRNDMAKVRQHQIGGLIGSSTALDGGNLVIVTTGASITEAIRNQYNNFSNVITTDRFVIDINNKSTSSGTSATYTSEWNGELIHTLAMIGASSGDGSANNIRYFFNSGGVLNFSATRTGAGIVIGTGSNNEKYTAWSTLLNGLGTISFGYTETSTTGSGTGSSIGWYDLTTSDQLIYQILGNNIPSLSGTEYSSNAYQIYAKRDVNSTTVIFSIKFCDFDVVGTDINVGGTLTSGLVQVHATGGNVTVLPLNVSGIGGNNTFSGGSPNPQYFISPSITTVSQGELITVTVTTQYVNDSTTLYWAKTPGSVAGDARLTTASGSVIVDNNTGSFTVTIATDELSHSNETFQLQLYTDAGHTILAGVPSSIITILGTNSIVTVNTYTLGSSYFIGSSSYSIFSAGANKMLSKVTVTETLTSIGTADDGTQWQNGYSTFTGTSSSIDSSPNSGNISIGTSIATSAVSNGVTMTVPANYVITGIAAAGYLYGTGNQAVTLTSYILIAPLLDSTGNIIPEDKIVHSGATTDTLVTSWNTSDTTGPIPEGTVIRSVTLSAAAGAHYMTCYATIVYETIKIRQ
jgi:hypothetical protein